MICKSVFSQILLGYESNLYSDNFSVSNQSSYTTCLCCLCKIEAILE